MRVDIEYLLWILGERAEINRANIEEIEFYRENKKLEFPEGLVDEFMCTGLNNVDFISSGYFLRPTPSDNEGEAGGG